MTPTLKSGRVISPGRPEKKDIFKEMSSQISEERGDAHGAKCIWRFRRQRRECVVQPRLQLRPDTLQRKVKNACVVLYGNATVRSDKITGTGVIGLSCTLRFAIVNFQKRSVSFDRAQRM